jgi:hypothetical protein
MHFVVPLNLSYIEAIIEEANDEGEIVLLLEIRDNFL